MTFILIIIMVIARQARISLFFPNEEKNPDKVISVKEMLLSNKNNGMRFRDISRKIRLNTFDCLL